MLWPYEKKIKKVVCFANKICIREVPLSLSPSLCLLPAVSPDAHFASKQHSWSLLPKIQNINYGDAVQICGKFWDTQYHKL